MALTISDKKYIHVAIADSFVKFKNELVPFFEDLMQQNRDHLTALQQQSREEFRLLNEMIQEKPNRSEVKEIIQEEILPIRKDLNQVEDRLDTIEEKLDTIEDTLGHLVVSHT